MNNKIITDLREEREAKHTALFNSCGLFWAFSDEQFAKNKTPLQEGEKYVSIGGGGYVPKLSVDKLEKGLAEVDAWFKEATKDAAVRKALIAYELNNHEAFYTYDMEPTLSALGEDYTEEEVNAVFKEMLKKC